MRVLAYFCAAFTAGCALSEYVLPVEWRLVAACLFLLLAAVEAYRKKGRADKHAMLCAIGAATAVFYAAAYDQLICAPNEALIGTTERTVMELCDYASETTYGAKATVRILGRGLHGRAVYYGDASLLALEPGAHVTDEVYYNSAVDPGNTGVTLRSFHAKGAYLLLYSRGEPTYETGNAGALRYAPQRTARMLGDTISKNYGEREAGFLRALLFGDKRYLDEADASHLAEVGLSHIAAVSGLHCAFLASLLGLFFGGAHRRIRCAVTIPLLFLYAFAVGASPSVLRAVVMVSMGMLAPLFGRESDPPTSVLFALLLILLRNPNAIASISLQLSFSAVAGLVFVTPRLTRRVHMRNKPLRLALTSFATTLGAMTFSTPLAAWYFGSLSLVSVLSNLLCLWMVSIVFALGLFGVVLTALLPQLGALAAVVPTVGIHYVQFVSALLGKLPLHAVYFNTHLAVLWLVYVYVMLAVCALVRRGRWRYPLTVALAIAMLLVMARANAAQYHYGELHVTALDVGQGASTAFLSDGHAALVDCGSSNSYIDAGGVAADYFASAGVTRLDSVVLTHYHADHSNGLAELFARMEVGTLYLADIAENEEYRGNVLRLAERYGVAVEYVTAITSVPNGAATLTIYPPVGEGTANELGLTILCSAGDFDTLITGDMDGETEQALISVYDFPDIEVLMVGHHGSKYSTSKQLLEAVTPEVGVISVGDNSYGHPTEDALLRLTDAHLRVYRTDLQGNIDITVD